MRYPHILARLRSARWAVQPATLQAIRDLLSTRLLLERPAARATPSGLLQPATSPQARPASGSPAIAVIPVFGIIGKRLDSLETECGGCDLDTVETAIASAMAAPSVRHIVLHFDSPGGVVTGVPELAAKIALWRETKPIYAFTDTLMASAAYWLASACTAILCTPTAEVGSIGVYMAAIDESEAWANEGYRLVLVKSGARKAEGIAGSSIAPETIAAWQAEVDDLYAMFAGAVSAHRPHVPAPAMQGQTMMGGPAQASGLVDHVIPDLATLLAEIARDI